MNDSREQALQRAWNRIATTCPCVVLICCNALAMGTRRSSEKRCAQAWREIVKSVPLEHRLAAQQYVEWRVTGKVPVGFKEPF